MARWLPEVYLDSTVAPEREYLAGGSRDDYIYDVAPTHSWNASCLTCHNTYPYVARLWNQSGAFESQVPWRGGYPKPSVEWLGEPNHQGRVKLGSQLRALHADELVTLGISCESCHFGGRDPRTGRAVASDREDPFVVNSICSQCHNAQARCGCGRRAHSCAWSRSRRTRDLRALRVVSRRCSRA